MHLLTCSDSFEDGDAPASPGGAALGSRRSSMNSPSLVGRRDSFRATFVMSAMTPDGNSPNASSRSLSTSQTTAALPLAADVTPAFSPKVESYEHGSYEFSPKELAAVKKRVQEEFLLKSVTKARPLAEQTRPENKVPFEFADPSRDEITHPSGFVVPAPGEAPSTLASETRARAPELNRGIPEGVVNFADLKELATADQSSRKGKVPQEVLGADGVVEHPSGFVPPSPQQPGMKELKDVFKPAVDLGTERA